MNGDLATQLRLLNLQLRRLINHLTLLVFYLQLPGLGLS